MSSKLIKTPGSVQTTGRLLDINALDTLERCLADDGDLIPSWAYWWLSLAAELSNNVLFAGSVLIYPAETKTSAFRIKKMLPHKVVPLMVEEMCIALGSTAWSSSSAMYALAWGVNNNISKLRSFPILCRGAVVPISDGMGVLFITNNNEERSALQSWIK